jgi:hypothetical protein
MEWIIKLAVDVGAVAAIAIFLVWNTWQRELRLGRRIDKLELYVQNQLFELVEKSTKALIDNGNAFRNLADELKRRPCWLEEQHKEKIDDV